MHNLGLHDINEILYADTLSCYDNGGNVVGSYKVVPLIFVIVFSV